jgi:hypothetical protein
MVGVAPWAIITPCDFKWFKVESVTNINLDLSSVNSSSTCSAEADTVESLSPLITSSLLALYRDVPYLEIFDGKADAAQHLWHGANVSHMICVTPGVR